MQFRPWESLYWQLKEQAGDPAPTDELLPRIARDPAPIEERDGAPAPIDKLRARIAGDPALIEELLERVAGDAGRLKWWDAGPYQHDVVVETVLSVYESVDRVTQPAALGTVVYHCYQNAWRKVMRQRRRETTLDEVGEREASTEIDPYALGELEALVAALPERRRQVVLLRFVQDWDFERIGLALGIKPGAARVAAFQAIKSLRTALGVPERKKINRRVG